MKFYELVVKFCMLSECTRDKAIDSSVDIIDKALCADEAGKALHMTNKFKNYCVSELYPVKHTYSIGDICIGRIRCADKSLADLLRKNLDKLNLNGMVVANVEVKELKQRHIYSLKTSSACTVSVPGVKGYWRDKPGIYESHFEKQIIDNLVKKYNSYTGEDIKNVRFSDVFIDYKFNYAFIKKKYKNITLLGDVVTFYPNNTDLAQKLCNFALAVGLGTRNARARGFTDAMYA